MHLTPLIFISVLLYAILPQQNNYTGNRFFSYQLDSIPNKARTIKVHNYLTPIPLSELGDSILNEFLPSLEGTIIATKEFKERYDMVVKHVLKTYKKDALKDGISHGQHEARILARDYLAYSEKNMYQIDSLLGDRYLKLSTSWEPCTYCGYIGYDLTKMSGKRKTVLALRDTIKDTYLNKLFLEGSYADWRITNFGYSSNVIHHRFLVANPNPNGYPLHKIETVRLKPKYYYPTLRHKERHLEYNKYYTYQHYYVKLTNKNIKQLEPYIILYNPRSNSPIVMNLNTNLLIVKDTSFSTSYYTSVDTSNFTKQSYFLALAESTDGQMLAGIRPFKISDTTAYTMELQPMEWTAFEKAVNALK
jgi:hypothetical protein